MATAVANAEPAPHRWRFPERLPEIRGGALVAYRAIWLIAAVLAVMSVTYFNYRWTVLQIEGSRIVFATGLDPINRYADGQHVRPLSPQARLAGVGDDDVIMLVNGRRLTMTRTSRRFSRAPMGLGSRSACAMRPEGLETSLSLETATIGEMPTPGAALRPFARSGSTLPSMPAPTCSTSAPRHCCSSAGRAIRLRLSCRWVCYFTS